MKKIIAIIITISMLVSSVPAFAISGEGTESNPYLISSASDIAKIHNDLDGYYRLTSNINMSGVAFEPIGNENEGAFTGAIDGAGYTISNLDINLPDNKYVGFVGYLEGTVKNLNIVNVDAYGYRYVGGLVGYAEENSEIKNCSVDERASGTYQIVDLNIGGIAGVNNGTIANCTNNGEITVTSSSVSYVGGIAGVNNGSIANCENDGGINLTNITKSYVGGISGHNSNTITNCMNKADVSVQDTATSGVRYSHAGGIAGIAGDGNSVIDNSINIGNVTSNNGNNVRVGGIVGLARSNTIIHHCINNGDVSGSGNYKYAGGITGINEGTISNCSNSGKGKTNNNYHGGITGDNYGKIKNCFNNGCIYGDTNAYYIGGIAGDNSGEINCCINGGHMIKASYTGGIIGKTSSVDLLIQNCINIGYVIGRGTNSSQWGGIGVCNSNLQNCYQLVDTKNGTANHGIILSSEELEKCGAIQSFDLDSDWYVNDEENSGFPQLRDMPRHIDLNKSIVIMEAGDSDTLYAYIAGTRESVTWSCDDTSIASVSSSGTVTAKSKGYCTVTATNSEGIKANCFVYVYGRASSMELSSGEININEGKTYTLKTVQSPNVANEAVKWYSEDESVASIEQNGVVTAKTKGTTTVYAITAQSGIRAECIVNVSAPITSISLSSTSKTINLGSIDIITATLSPADYEGSITWSSSDENIVSVDQEGKITAHKIGTAYITATATSGITAQCTVTVTQPSTSVTMNKPRITTHVNSTYQLSASMLPLDTTDTITWSSSSTTYATVSSTGLVTGKRVGTATITARTSSGLTATCYVTVKATPIEPTSITLSETYITLAPEDAKALTATLLPSNATETTLIWTSSNDDVATVDKNGVITAIGEGFAMIKAKTANGLSHECVVKVVSASGPSIIVDNVKSFPAGIAKTKVNIIRNPGISGYKFTISYDDALLTPVSVTVNEEFGGTLTTNLEDENRTEFNVVWYSNGDTDIDINGELFTIDFKVAETAELGDYSDISIEYGAKDICNTAGENIALYTESAKVTVEEPLAGDIYEDGDVNIYDLTLLARYMIGLADFTDRQLEAANVTDDELVDIKDVVKLAQYVVGWTGIELMSLMSLSAEIPETPTVTVGTASVNDAKEADIPVYIQNNTGIAAYRFVLDYNADDIEIVSITPSDLINPENFGTNLGQENDEGLIVFCYQESNTAADGELFTIKVRYKNPADTSISPISIKSAENNFCNQTIENVVCDYVTGYALDDDYIVANKVVSDTNLSCELYFGDSYAEQTAKAIIAFYDGDDRMVQLQSSDITVKPGKVDLSIDYDKKAYTTYKLMIWEDINSLKSITKVK